MKKICVVSTVSIFWQTYALKELIQLSQHFEITIVTGDKVSFNHQFNTPCAVEIINIPRNISLLNDVKALLSLVFYFKKNKFDIILSATPKAGLLTMLAAFFIRCPHRVHYFTGQVWASKQGFKKQFLKFMDKLIIKASTDVLIDSHGQKKFLIQENMVSEQSSKVISHGLNAEKFKLNLELKEQLKQQYKIDKEAICMMFLGRINKDKGIVELMQVVSELLTENKNLHFFLVGEYEADISLKQQQFFANLDRVFVLGRVEKPQNILNLVDILVLPSYREGSSQTPLEAGLMKIPAIVSDIYGLADSVVHQQTGLIHKVKDTLDMKQKYLQLINDIVLRKRLGEGAYQRTKTLFNQEKTTQEFTNYFLEMV